MLTYLWNLKHCQVLVTAESKEDAIRIALGDNHLLDATKNELSRTDPLVYIRSIIGVLPKFNYIVEINEVK